MPRLTLVAVLLLAGCGAVYIPPSVDAVSRTGTDTVDVVVVPMTPNVVQTANASPYTPRSLPTAFSSVTGVPGQPAIGRLPDAPGTEVARPDRLALRPPPPEPAAPYRIGVADVLLLATSAPVTSEEALSGLLAAENRRQGYTVQDDGTIAIPDAGRVRVADLTVEEAEAEVFQALVAAQLDPTFSLEISEFNSKRASVGGAVATPRLVPITLKPVTLGEAIQLAGGITAPDQDFVSIRMFRNGRLYQIPFSEFFSDPQYQRITIQDTDAVFVDTEYNLAQAEAFFRSQIDLVTARAQARANALEQLQTEFEILQAQQEEVRTNFTRANELEAVARDYVYRAGEVRLQGRLALPFERTATLADALFAEGGFANATANPAQIYLLRGFMEAGGVRAYHLDARNPANLVMAANMELRPNDFIFIEEQPITKWNRVLSQLGPNLFARDVITVTQL